MYKITPELTELINEKKNNKRNEQKIQLSMDVSFMHNTNKKKSCTFYVKSDNVEIRLGDNINEIITRIYESFLNNYQKEEQI